jgi:DNA-binding transcriptional LysR family regulator
MNKGLKLQQLRYVLAVLDEGGFKAAAKHLHRTQPALSLGIRELEDSLGAALLEKQGAGRLTPFGEGVYSSISRVTGCARSHR